MKKLALAAALLLSPAAIIAAAPSEARAAPGDTCYETPTVNIDCSDKPTAPAKKAPARRAKIAKTPPAPKGPSLADRITDAQSRVEAALDEHAKPGAEREFKSAMADLHKVYGEAIAAKAGDKS